MNNSGAPPTHPDSAQGARRDAAAAAPIFAQVECTSRTDAREACEAGADVIMLDNYGGEELRAVATELKARWPHVIIEASGGITVGTMPQFFSPHVDVISQGALTNGYATLDFSLKVPKPEAFAARARTG